MQAYIPAWSSRSTFAKREIEKPPRYWSTRRRSVGDLFGWEFKVLLCGDGTPVRQGAKSRIMGLVDTFPK